MNPTLAAHAAAILTILIWGATFTSTKVLLQAFAPIEILFLRFLLGACALLLACPRLLHVRDRRREVTFALAGLCGVTLYFLLENIALSYSTASNVGVLVGISPFLTALLARIVLGESLHPGFFVGFVCAMSGIVCIAVNSNAVLRLNPLGDVLALLAALTWAFYSILTRKIGDYGYNTLQVTRRIFCWDLLFMLPTLPLSGFRWGLERLAQPEMLANLLFLGLGASALCFATWNFTIRILGAITNAVLSRLDMDELVSEVAKEIHYYFDIDDISIVLRSHRKNKLNIYSTHYLDKQHPAHEQSEVDEAGTLTERVFKSKEMLLINLHERDDLAPYERMLFDTWGNQIQTLCLLPLMSGDTMLGVLKLAQCEEKVFTTTNLNLLRQIAERVAIAVDNALAYQEIHRLKERLVDENLALTEQLNNVDSEFGEIIGRSEAMYSVLKQVEMVAQSDSTVLILGETGTGKELIARAIHNLSGRNNRRMVKMNCAAMPAGLLESDLFGHERGAFTGASAQRIGRFELADKSSLFLDEVGDMPLELQPKLLRVLQEQEFERLGSNKIIQTDVRLIAATNRDLKKMVADREFRSDLYYRLNVFPIHLPPLRERPEDIPLLAKAFTFKIARRLGRNIDSIPAETLRTLSNMEWPGNVRELENVIERAVLLTRGNVLQLSLPDIVLPEPETPPAATVVAQEGEDEYQLIVRVLKETNGVVAGPKGAAQRLGLKRTTLLSRMKRLGIDKSALI